MIIFSNTCGIGLNGARSMKIAAMIRIEYGILSRIAHMITRKELKIWVIFQINDYLSRK
jgi:hypothetical protein